MYLHYVCLGVKKGTKNSKIVSAVALKAGGGGGRGEEFVLKLHTDGKLSKINKRSVFHKTKKYTIYRHANLQKNMHTKNADFKRRCRFQTIRSAYRLRLYFINTGKCIKIQIKNPIEILEI